MGASSVTRRSLIRLDFRKWAWWQLPLVLRCYVGLTTLVALVVTSLAASRTVWHASDLEKYALLLGCSVIAVAGKPGGAYRMGGMTRDFLSAWVLPVAIVLPPVYAMITPIPLQVLTQMRVHKGVIFRRVFTVAAIGMCYGGASLLFRTFPASFAGRGIGTGTHALTWTLAVAACEVVAGRGHNLMIAIAVKLSDPTARLIKLELDREALQADFAEFDLGILISIVVVINPILELFAIPTVLLIRRFMMHEQLLAQSRTDAKTGLLNASAWEAEATTEVVRAIRTRSPLSIALIDIDHFKTVNDTHGHLVGDTVLRAVTDAIQEHLRVYDRAGRFGGEEFVVLLPQARQADAVNIAERLRTRIAAMSIPVNDSAPDGTRVQLTVSVGVAALDDHTQELNDLMAAADAALYQAKQTGRNRTCTVQLGAPADLRDPAAVAAPQPAS